VNASVVPSGDQVIRLASTSGIVRVSPVLAE
jgi:hypothetical protein